MSSDGIATALQDSASALMAGGNSLEQAVALVASANRVVQDPNSVGSALRTISLRLRGTSVKILEEMGEETEGVVESTSKLQEKIKALSGVDILTNAGDYKDTYTILKEIGQVWEDMSDIDQAALLELMAGKNRANTLSAILSNMEDLEGAYESAMNAEGSAAKENAAYMDSIQGRIDLFNNSVQTMWMNTLHSDVIKFFVDLGTGLIEIVDKLGLVRTTIAGILTYVFAFSKNKIDLASILGIHNLDESFLKGFSAFGKQGLSGWIANLFKTKEKVNITETVFGDPNDIKVSVEDFASAIQDNINDYVTIDTAEIDSAIDGVQQKLTIARQQLADAKTRDWDYYRSLGSKTPAKDRDNSIAEKTKEIENLETKLTELQAKRDSIVSSAVNDVATSMVASINNETQAYQSMLSVLSEVQDMKLYLGSEQDAAIKIDAMSAAAKNGQTDLANYVSSLGDADIALKAYAASVEDGNYSLAGFQQFITQHNAGVKASGVAAKAAAVGHQLLNAALSMGVSLLASFVIEGIVKGLDKLITTSKEAAEAAEDALNKYKSANETLRNQKKAIDELSGSYERLSKGVDLNTNENISLTTASYEEYLDICNEIADMYPHLVTGYDAQGNAILSLKGNVDQLTQAYREAAQAARQQMIASGDDIFETFSKTYDNQYPGFNKSGIKQQLEVAQKLLEAANSGNADIMQAAYDDAFDNNGNALSDLLKSSGLKHGDFRHWFDGDVIVDSFQQTAPKLLSFIKSTTTQINTETNKVKSLMSAYLGEDFDYAQLSDRSRAMVDQIVAGLNADFINGFEDADTLYNWIKTNIVDAFTDPSVIDAINSLTNLQIEFNKGDISYSDYKKQLNDYVSQIQNKVDSNALNQIKIGIGIDEASLQTAADHAIALLGGRDRRGIKESKVWSLSVEDLEIAGQLEVPEGTILSLDELTKKIEEAKIAATQDFDITNYTKSISSLSATISEYQEALQKLGKGSFTMDDFMELIEKYPELAKGVDISSNAFYGLSRNLNRAINTSTKDFIKDLQELKVKLVAAGKSTDAIDQLIEAIEKMPDNALDDVIKQYSTLTDKINSAKTAQDKLLASMEENPNEGYETRGEAMEYMKEAMAKGEIGSESNLWNVAEKYGFTYDSAKSINENADALAKFIAIREKWFKQDDDGDDRTDDGYSYKGTESFIKDVESAVANDAELQKLLTWDYDETTGTLNFDYDNKDWDTIISILSKTEKLAGLTSDEFADLMIQVGQYFGINWGNYDDVLDHLNGIATSSSDAKTKVEEYGQAMQDYFGENTTVDLAARPMVSGAEMQSAGWANVDADSYATVYSSTFSNEDGTKSIVVTPILPDGTVLSPQELKEYANKLLAGETIDPDINIKLAEFDGANSTKQANEYAEALHKAQEEYDKLRDTLGINATIDQNGVNGLTEIAEIQKAIETKADGTVVINEDAFREALAGAKYTEDQIDIIIEKIKKLNGDAFNIDPFKIDETIVNQGISGLEEIEKVRDSLTKDEATGLTVFDTDMFTSALKEAGYTKDQIDALIKKIQEYEGVVSTSSNTDPLGLNNTNFSIDTLKASLSTLGVTFDETIGTWFDGKKDLTINVTDLVTTLKAKGWTDQSIKEYITKLSSNTNLEGFNVKVNGIENIDEVIKTANEVPEEESTKYTVTGTGLSTVQTINSEWDNVPKSKSTEYTITETTIKKTETEDDGAKWWNPLSWLNGTAHSQGTAFSGGSWGAPRTETALTGELGPEILVRNGRWTTVGENGAEFTQVKKGDIIFNHKQSEQLLKNGYVTGRGKAYASGTAYAEGGGTFGRYDFSGSGGYIEYDVLDNVVESWGDLSGAAKDAADAASDAADKFEETFDWIEVRLEEINEQLDLLSAELENEVGYENQNTKIDEIISLNNAKMANLKAGLQEYANYASKLLAKIPAEFQEAAKNGAIAITEFVGEANEATVEAIEQYREWAQKVADVTQQIEELETEIADLAKQKFDNIVQEFENITGLIEKANEKLEAQITLMEESGYVASAKYYEAMMENTKKIQEELEKEKAALQATLDEQVRLGNIKVNSTDWYEMVDAIYEVDLAIMDCTLDLEKFQNAINDIYWDNFEELINRIDYLKNQTEGLIGVLSHDDLISTPDDEEDDGWSASDVEWTDEGLASLGLYAQQMEVAEYQARQYAEAIDDLTKDFEAGKYSESEYYEKLNELTEAQYDSIEAYYDAQDAIVDLQKKRVDAIKNGIEKEVEAYEKLIKKQKEALNAEKDLHDFQESIMEQEKNIAAIERKLAALSGDTSMAAAAERKKLEAELAEAQHELEEMYYDRSVEDKQNALDNELESFKEEKDAEIEKWEEYLDDIETVITESLGIIQANASGIYDTLSEKANEYNLTLSDAIMTPWKDGASAISDYQTAFDTAISSTTGQLELLKQSWQDVIDSMDAAAGAEINRQMQENGRYTSASNSGGDTYSPTVEPKPEYTTYTVKSGDTLWGIASKYLGSGSQYSAIYEANKEILSDPNLIYPGQKLQIPQFADGTTEIKRSQLALIDELGDELVLHAQKGKIAYLTKGSAVIPHDISENLMELGELDPSDLLRRNTPKIVISPSVVNNNIEINMEIAEVVHIDTVSNETIPDLTKAIEKQMDKYMKQVNSQIRKFTR